MQEEQHMAIETHGDEQVDEHAHYECAFHILPTVAEEEVSSVVERLKNIVARLGGTITDEESPEVYDLAYEITKQIDGTNRRFRAAYFGWMRFLLAPAALADLHGELAHTPEVLRQVVVRLTRQEAQHPFSLFETRRAVYEEGIERGKKGADGHEEMEGPVSETVLNESLGRMTV